MAGASDSREGDLNTSSSSGDKSTEQLWEIIRYVTLHLCVMASRNVLYCTGYFHMSLDKNMCFKICTCELGLFVHVFTVGMCVVRRR